MVEEDSYPNLARLKSAYAERYLRLKCVAELLAKVLHELLDGGPRVDQIAVRVKSLERLLEPVMNYKRKAMR
jgi:hypothetical protein